MKRYKTAIVAAILIVVVVAAFFVGKNMLPENSGEAEPTMDTTRGYVFPFSTDKTSEQKIVGLDCIGKETLLLRKQSNSWVCTTYPELQVAETNVQSLITKLYSYDGAIVYEGAVTEAIRTEFGLDGQTKLVVTMKDGTAYTAVFGGMNTASTAQYIWLEGSETIYLYAKGFRTSVLLNKVDLISKTIFDFSDVGQIVRVAVWKDNVRTMDLAATLGGTAEASREWHMSYPLDRAGKNDNIESWLTKVVAITISDIAEINCTDKSVYGLSPAAYSVSLTAPDKTIVLRIGNKTKDGTQYYACVGDDNDVYLIDESLITFKDMDPLPYMDKVVYMVMYTELAHVRITMNGVTRTMSYEFDEKNEPTYIFEGHRISDKDSDEGDAFTRLLTSLYLLEMTGLEIPGPTGIQGDVLCTVEFELRNGIKNTVVCTTRDAATMYYYVNGQYIGGYGNQYYLTSGAAQYGVQGCLNDLLKIMKLS